MAKPQKIRIELDAGNAQTDVAALMNSFDKLKADVYELAVPIDTVTSRCYAMANAEESLEAQTKQVTVGLSAVDLAMQEVAESSDRAAKSIRKAGEESKSTKQSLVDYQQRIQGLGYTVNDFVSVSGDMSQRLNAIANNMPMLLAGFGGLGLALSAILPIVGLIIKQWDTISSLWEDRKPITGATESLDGMSEALKRNKQALEDLREKGSLNLSQLQEFNRLTEEGIRLEKEFTAAKETEANRKAMGPLSNERAQERAGAVKKAVKEAGGYDSVLNDIVDDYLESIGKKDDATVRKDVSKQLSEVMNRALQGDEKAISHITSSNRGKIGSRNFLGKMVDRFDPSTARINAKDVAALDDEYAAEDAAEKEREKTARENERRQKEAADFHKVAEAEKAREADKQVDAMIAEYRKNEKDIKAEAQEKLKHTGQSGRTSDAISQASGGELTGRDLSEATGRSLQLQRQNIDLASANQQAMAEQYAIINGMQGELMQLRANADQIIRYMRTQNRRAAMADMSVTNLNMGGPGS